MKDVLKYIFFVMSAFTISAYGQISPGDLVQSHAELEGMFNCTKCHDLGEKVSNKKCLECHEFINDLIEKERGYHASEEVVGKDCFECHSDHHGRKFDMIHFDDENFNHDLTGYILEDKHDEAECKDCHDAKYIQNEELQKRTFTYLGLEQKCLSCHEDYHQETLSEDCASCHNIIDFTDPEFFDHQKTDYPLEGEHLNVDCIACHEKTILNGKDFQQFSDVAFDDCASCHDDPHKKELSENCSTCHSVKSFTEFIGGDKFDHTTTDFTLIGAHKTVDCFSCHEESIDPFLALLDHKEVQENQCATCHDDVHEDQFGNDCAKCHIEDDFFTISSSFSHDLTAYPLEGKHENVDCEKCHTTDSYIDEINFSACTSCHDDFHEGVFDTQEERRDCAACHSLNEGFDRSTYTIEDHNNSQFPLEGAHKATPCFSCHLKEEAWEFKEIGLTCVECHEDVHVGQFEEEGFTDCKRCHDSFTWDPSNFNHSNTDFPLEGRHAEVECAACHKSNNDSLEEFTVYKIRNYKCTDCHSY